MENIIVNNIDITNLVTSFEIYEEMDQDTLIGSAVSTQIKIKLRNKDNKLQELLDYPFIIGNKTYIVYEKPEKWTKTISVTLYDQMILTNVAYNTQLQYPTKISNQLDEMAKLSGVAIDKTTLSTEVLNKEVNWYDNSMIIRNYISFIAQCDGKNAFIENDKVVFKQLALNTLEAYFCSDYELNELLTFSRVCYDDGLNILSKGDETNKTLYLTANNSYVTQEDIDRIYEMYNGLSFYSFKTFKCRTVGVKLTDLVYYNGFTIMPLSIKTIVYGGEATDSYELSGDITIKNVDSVVVKENTQLKIKRIQTLVDQNEQTLEILAQDLEDGLGEVASLKIEVGRVAIETESTSEKVEELANQIEITLSNNLPLTQIYETETNLYIPDYSETNMTITATCTLLDRTVVTNRCNYTWKRKTSTGEETDLTVGEVANGNVLTINRNVLSLDRTIEYICYATLNTLESKQSISLGLNVIGQDGKNGADAILLQIESVNGYSFKNTGVSTTLLVVITVAGERITDSKRMYEVFGSSAKLHWYQKKMGEIEFTEISSSDSRITDNGFIFTISAKDVDNKNTFSCQLEY